MRTSITVFRKHGSAKFELASGPEVPVYDQESDFRELLKLNGIHPEFAEVQRWEDGSGHLRTLKFQKPEEAKAYREKVKADHAKFVEAQKNPEKQAADIAAAKKKSADELAEKNKTAHAEVTAKTETKLSEQQQKNIEAHKKATAEAEVRYKEAQARKDAEEKSAHAAAESGSSKATEPEKKTPGKTKPAEAPKEVKTGTESEPVQEQVDL